MDMNICFSVALNNFSDFMKPRSIFKITHISHVPHHLKDLGVQVEPLEACLGTMVIFQIDATSYPTMPV